MFTESRKKQNKYPYKVDVYAEFILWFAMPPIERIKLGIENQNQFAEYYSININTLTKWKNRTDFEDRVDKIQRMWGLEKTADVIQGIYRAAVKGNPASQLLWMQYFKKFNPKQEIEHTHIAKVELAENDIRRLIEILPENLKIKHYGYLRELLDDASAYRSSQQLEDSRWTERPALAVPVEADYNAPDIPEPKASPVPKSYPHSLRANMVWEIPAHHYQSPERWR
jgi:hypothetical protein